MRKSGVITAISTRNSVTDLEATCNILVLELRSRFGGKFCDLFQGTNTEAVNQHRCTLRLTWFYNSKCSFRQIL